MKPNPAITSTGEWLSLKDAAGILNVHLATLRRWADNGDVPHMITPGGHRRFLRDDVLAFAASHKVHGRVNGMPEAWATRAIEHARSELPAQAGSHWMQTMDASMRDRHRAIGRKLMALTLQYVSSDDDANSEHLLNEALAVGREYGEANIQSGVSLSDSMQAALFFRDRLLEASLELPETTRPRNSDQRKLLKRINALLSAVQLAIAGVYEQSSSPVVHQYKHTKPAQTRKRAGR
jgi:excisionase family DNA binding protein